MTIKGEIELMIQLYNIGSEEGIFVYSLNILDTIFSFGTASWDKICSINGVGLIISLTHTLIYQLFLFKEFSMKISINL